MVLGSALIILIILFSIGYLWVKKRYNYWNDRGFLQTKTTFPHGSLKGLGSTKSSVEIFQNIYKEFKGKGPIVGMFNFLSPALIALDLELIKNILIRDFKAFNDRGFFHNKKDDPVGSNILTLAGQEWKDRRIKLSPIFTSGKMKMMFDIIDEINDKFVTIIGNKTSENSDINIRNWLQRLTMDNIANTAFGINPRCIEIENTEFETNGRRVFTFTSTETIQFIIGSGWPELGRKLGFRFTPAGTGEFFLDTFLETLDYREKNKVDRNDFVQLLLGLKDQFTREELAAEAFLIFVGGFETSSTTLTFGLYELALNPEIQQRLRQEITNGIAENDGKLTYDLLYSFKYLDMFVNEVLRKYPPIPAVQRKADKDYLIPNTKLVIPKGTLIAIDSYSLQHDPEYYPDPERFDPERFSDENVKNIKPFTNLPFGDGPRNCLGLRFGLMQSKIGFAKVVSNFEISTCSKTTIPMEFSPENPLLAPIDGMWLNMKKIE